MTAVHDVPRYISEATMGRTAQGQLTLSEAERQELLALTAQCKTAQALALRAQIVLSCAQGLQNKAVVLRHRVT